MSQSERLFERAKLRIPGGVNSPVRAFHAVEGTPRFISRAEKQYIYDVDGTRYTDYIGSWGPMLLGHNHPHLRKAAVEAVQNGVSFGTPTPAEVDMAEFICSTIPSIQMVRMVNSGTEAVMSAIRLARAFTKKDKVIKFEGCYHGHSDSMLVKAGSGSMTTGVASSAGVTQDTAKDTLTAVYNDIDSVQKLFAANFGQVAAVIIEPVAANMGVILPADNFLQALRALCDKHHALLIFDEVITGFRLGLTGAQGWYGVVPDLTTFGKIIGAGMPVGAYGGRWEIMEYVSPVGPVYQAGTLSGNPVAMAMGLEQLRILKQHPVVYEHINSLGDYYRKQLRLLVEQFRLPYTVSGIGSLSCLFFTEQPVTDYKSASTADTKLFAKFFHHLLDFDIHIAPSQFEAIFFCNEHQKEDIDDLLTVTEDFFSRRIHR